MDGLRVCQQGLHEDCRINFDIRPFEFGAPHPHASGYRNTVVIHDLLPYLDDYITNAHDPLVEDFIWSMGDNRHTESKSTELTEGDVPKLLLFADRDVINIARTKGVSSAAEVAGRDPSGAQAYTVKLRSSVPFSTNLLSWERSKGNPEKDKVFFFFFFFSFFRNP